VARVKVDENSKLISNISDLESMIANLTLTMNLSKEEILKYKQANERHLAHIKELNNKIDNVNQEFDTERSSYLKEINQLKNQLQSLIEKKEEEETPFYTTKDNDVRRKKTGSAIGNQALNNNISKLNKLANPGNNGNSNLKSNDNLLKGIGDPNLLKCQLEIVDLKKRLDEEEGQKLFLAQIIKTKNEELKSIRSEINKFEEIILKMGDDAKRMEHLNINRCYEVKLCKEKLIKQDKEIKRLMSTLAKTKLNPNTSKEVGIDAPKDDLFPILAKPHLFGPDKNYINK